MNKKVLSILLALAMVLSMAPVSLLTAQEVSAEAESLTGNVSDGHGEHSEADGWTAWDGISTITTGGNYYLTEETTPKTSVITNNVTDIEVTLCLNGQNLNANGNNRLFYMGSNMNVTICDCRATVDANGKLTSTNQMNAAAANGSIACFVNQSTGSTLVMEKVILDGTTMSAPENGCHGILSWSTDAQIRLSNCVIRDFTAGKDNGDGTFSCTYLGAGVSLHSGGDLTAQKVWFENNHAVSTNTGSDYIGRGAGAIYAPAGSDVTLDYCTFDGNSNNNGGGAINMRAGGLLKATNVTFKNNSISNTGNYGGAAILIPSGGTQLDMNGCIFENNNSSFQGGAVALNSGNNANCFTDCIFRNNTSTSIGAAIYNGNGAIKFVGCTFSGNRTTGGNGSAISTNGGAITLENSTVTSNIAAGTGAVQSSTANINVVGNTQICNNTASDAKKADVYLVGTNKLVLGAMDQNAKINVATGTPSDDPNSFVAWASGVTPTESTCVTYTTSDPAKVVAYDTTNSTFIFNTRQLQVPQGSVSHHDHGEDGYTAWTGNGTKVEPAAGKYYLTADLTTQTITVKQDITLCLNGYNLKPASGGWRLFDIYGTGNLKICDCQASVNASGELISSNKVSPAVDSKAGTVSIAALREASAALRMDCVVVDGAAIDPTVANGCLGIGTWNATTTITLTNCAFRNMSGNSAAGYPGGAVSMYSGGTLNATNVLFENNAEENTAKGGGAIYSHNANTVLMLDNCQFKSNEAQNGGAIYLLNVKSLTATECTFETNKADANGGAIYTGTNASKLDLTDCEFEGNTAAVGGGAICMDIATTATMDACTFDGNESASGGAIKINVASDVTATDCVFNNNSTTSGTGGAINADVPNNKITLTGGSFTNNEATGGGGAISLNGDLSANGTSFTGNSSGANGGALFPRANIGTVTITDCPFTSNTASGYGGAISLHSTGMTLTGCDFTRNISYHTTECGGGAIYGFRTVNATDCTFTENRANFNGGAIYSNNNLHLTDCTLTGNTAKNLGGGVFYDSTNMNVYGTTKIDDNTVGSTEQNVYLASTCQMKLSSLESGASVGVTAADTAEGTAVATISDGTYEAGMIFSDVAERYVDGDADGVAALSLKTASAIVDGVGYPNIGEAAAANGGTVTLNGNVTENVTLPATTGEQAVQIDLNGNDIGANVTLSSAGTTTLYVADSSLGYDSTAPAVIPKDALGENVTIPKEGYKVGNRRYVAIENGNNIEIHRVQLTVTAKALRPTNNGIGFKVKFSAAESVKGKVTDFGIKFQVKNGIQGESEKYMNLQTEYNKAMENGQELTILVDSILEEGNANNATNATYTIEGTPFIKINGIAVDVEGATISANYKDMFEYAASDAFWNTAKKAQKDAIHEMYGRFEDVMSGWNIDNIKNHTPIQ